MGWGNCQCFGEGFCGLIRLPDFEKVKCILGGKLFSILYCLEQNDATYLHPNIGVVLV